MVKQGPEVDALADKLHQIHERLARIQSELSECARAETFGEPFILLAREELQARAKPPTYVTASINCWAAT